MFLFLLQRMSSNLLLMKQTPPHGDNDLLHAPNSVIYTRHITAAQPCSNTAGHRTCSENGILQIYCRYQSQVYSVGFLFSHNSKQKTETSWISDWSFNLKLDHPTYIKATLGKFRKKDVTNCCVHTGHLDHVTMSGMLLWQLRIEATAFKWKLSFSVNGQSIHSRTVQTESCFAVFFHRQY